MRELDKLRRRLKNSVKSTEYRMTTKEAHALVDEIDALIKCHSVSAPVITVATRAAPLPRILDGGTFTDS